MALQSNFFGKRDAESLNPANRPAATGGTSSGTAGATNGGASHTTNSPVLPTNAAMPGGNFSSPVLNTGRGASMGNANASSAAAPATGAATTGESASRLTVGPHIKLKGVEITDCDTLVVEGMVEATMDSRVIQIAEQGAFKGSAEIDIAEIHGVFEGSLTARQKLVIYATGRVTGKIRYGKLVVEEGGQLSGEIQVSGNASASAFASGGAAEGAHGDSGHTAS